MADRDSGRARDRTRDRIREEDKTLARKIAQADDDTSESTSESSSEDDELGEVQTPQATMQWFLQGSRIHITAEHTSEGRALPCCRVAKGIALTTEAKERGVGIASARAAGQICTNCMRRVPKNMRAALATSADDN